MNMFTVAGLGPEEKKIIKSTIFLCICSKLSFYFPKNQILLGIFFTTSKKKFKKLESHTAIPKKLKIRAFL